MEPNPRPAQPPRRYRTFDPKYLPESFGLGNTGVICWMNSLLQSLITCTSVNKTLIDLGDTLRDPWAVEYERFIGALVPNAQDAAPLQRERLGGASARLHGEFVTALRRDRPGYSMGYSQECASEAFILFLDLLNKPQINNLFSIRYMYEYTCAGCNKVMKIDDHSKYIMWQPEVPRETLEDFVGYILVHLEKVNGYKCPECKAVTSTVAKREELRRVSEVITILFNKYKYKSLVWYPERFELPGRDGPLKYRLVARICHSGNELGGHYWASALRYTPAGESVRTLNDLSDAPGDFTPTPETFMLFYHMYE